MPKTIPLPLQALVLSFCLSPGPALAAGGELEAQTNLQQVRTYEAAGKIAEARALLKQILADKKARAISQGAGPVSAKLDLVYTLAELLAIRMDPTHIDRAGLTVKAVKESYQRNGSRLSSQMADAITLDALIEAEHLQWAKKQDQAETILACLTEVVERLDKNSSTRQRLLSDYDIALRMQGKASAAESMEKLHGRDDYRIPFMAAQAMAAQHGTKFAIGADLAAEKMATAHACAEDLARVRMQLAGDYVHVSEYAKAAVAFDKCLPVLRKMYWETSSQTLIEPLTQRLICLSKLGKTQQAQAAYNDLLDCCKKTRNPQEIETAKAVAQMLGIK